MFIESRWISIGRNGTIGGEILDGINTSDRVEKVGYNRRKIEKQENDLNQSEWEV